MFWLFHALVAMSSDKIFIVRHSVLDTTWQKSQIDRDRLTLTRRKKVAPFEHNLLWGRFAQYIATRFVASRNIVLSQYSARTIGECCVLCSISKTFLNGMELNFITVIFHSLFGLIYIYTLLFKYSKYIQERSI